jgi:hypothetical protein
VRGIDVRSYEHHSLEEPAVDCWNITDGIIDVGIARLILREGYWSDHLEANGTHLLGIGLKALLWRNTHLTPYNTLSQNSELSATVEGKVLIFFFICDRLLLCLLSTA